MLSCRIDKKYDLTTKRTKATKDSFFLMLSNFVLFASFVVKILFRIWLRLCRAEYVDAKSVERNEAYEAFSAAC